MPDIQQIMQIPWGRLFLLFFCIYLLLCAFAFVYADKILFPAPHPSSCRDDQVDFYLTTDMGLKIACARSIPEEPSQLVILYSHGNAEDLGDVVPYLPEMVEEGMEVIAYDYPGYGLSEGKPSESGCYEAIEAVYKHMINELEIDPARIVVWGRSLGTGPSCHLAATQKVGGLLLEAPFLSAFRSITEIPVFPGDRFRNLERIAAIKSPSLVIHGRLDEVIPFRQGKRIHMELPEPKSFLEIPTASHNDLNLKGGVSYHAAIRDFLSQVIRG